MPGSFRLALAQINPVVGDLRANTEKIVSYINRARAAKADLIAFPELAIPGYPPEDLLFKPHFIAGNKKALEEIVARSQGIAVVVGFADSNDDIYNAAAVIQDGKLAGVYHKFYLPNYAVFDEERYFKRGESCPVFVIDGVTVGVNVCEDIWYSVGPTDWQRQAGAQLIVNINGSPFNQGKQDLREDMIATRASDNSVIVSYTNMVGGQDELVFDGGSMVYDPNGKLMARASRFEEELLVVDLDVPSVFRSRLHYPRWRQEAGRMSAAPLPTPRVVVSHEPVQGQRPAVAPRLADQLSPHAETYKALVMGTHDYVRKNGFKRVVIGLSGGIDSSLTATVATDALGSDSVVGVLMPSRYTSEGSAADATALAKALGIQVMTVPIEEVFSAYLHTLAPQFKERPEDVTEENIQARIRGNLLMALSNKFGWLVLSTGDKSETACGFTTLYGDMAGGFAVIKDVFKTQAYELARYRNTLGPSPVIPQRILERAPTPELRANQLATDTLPPYAVLDPILKAYVEEDCSLDDMVRRGHDAETVKRVMAMVDRSEYKRRQGPPGVRITARAFGRDRRLPMVNRYRDT